MAVLAWAFAALLALTEPADFTPGALRPHVIYLMADDLGWADVGWHGGMLNTPHLDQLAKRGARLEQFYVQPLCTPTRAAFLTGRYPMRYGLQVGVIRPRAAYGLPLNERTLAQALAEAGYQTALCGKWHLGEFDPRYLPVRRGFHHQYGQYFGAIDYFTHERNGILDWHRDDQDLREDGYATHLLAEEACRLIRQRDTAKPLFLFVAFNAVHAPHQAPEQYKQPFMHLPEPRRTYAAMLAAMDEAIGKILLTVDQDGLREKTLIFFSSDNGGPQPGRVTSNGHLRAGKGTLYEGGVRVPALAAWSGKIPAGVVVDEVIHIVDCYATIMELAGARRDQALPIDGLNVWPTLERGLPGPRRELLLNAAPNSAALRQGNWKLVVHRAPAAADGQKGRKNAAQAELELFDLASDSSERVNLADKHPDQVARLAERLEAFRAQSARPRQQE
jgi:arylsulfatase A-like enzyme